MLKKVLNFIDNLSVEHRFSHHNLWYWIGPLCCWCFITENTIYSLQNIQFSVFKIYNLQFSFFGFLSSFFSAFRALFSFSAFRALFSFSAFRALFSGQSFPINGRSAWLAFADWQKWIKIWQKTKNLTNKFSKVGFSELNVWKPWDDKRLGDICMETFMVMTVVKGFLTSRVRRRRRRRVHGAEI